MKAMRQVWAKFPGAVALLLGSALIATAQLPHPDMKTPLGDMLLVVSGSSNGLLTAERGTSGWAKGSLLVAHLRILDWPPRVALTPRPARPATNNDETPLATVFAPTRWSRDKAVASVQAVPAPRFSFTLRHEEAGPSLIVPLRGGMGAKTLLSSRVQTSPYPFGIFPHPPLPGQPQTPTTQAQQYGYELFRWQP
jgi:hypothetical protein